MGEIRLLDCTLRDGGYVNNWEFGEKTICSMIDKLTASEVDYIECGYLSEIKGGSKNSTQFKDLSMWKNILPKDPKKGKYALMIDYGKYEINHIPAAEDFAPIIRVCFHKKDMEGALVYCENLMQKGYQVFVQPMTTLNYTDEEFLRLIHSVNTLKPSGFYIVDSFGALEIYDFKRLLFLADNNLDRDIMLGYHAHNNLQQAYGNAKYMAEQDLMHSIVIDASVYGMGRGAGNLNLELFAAHLNREYGKNYNINSFLEIMDEHLKPIFMQHYWGYSLPFYLSAQINCHPNYAGYFSEKNTLTQKSLKELLFMLPDDVKSEYSEVVAEQYYQEYQKRYVDDKDTIAQLKDLFWGKNILILAPGKSLETQRETIQNYIAQKNPVVIGLNALSGEYQYHYLFCSNEKRYRALNIPEDCRMIVTSNIPESEGDFRVNYASYLAEDDFVVDNPAIMLLNLLLSMKIGEAAIAGMDGYRFSSEENYFDSSLTMGSGIETKIKKNRHVSEELKKVMNHMDLLFLTDSLYLKSFDTNE